MAVNTFTAGDQEKVKVVALQDGGWVIVWESTPTTGNKFDGQDGYSSGIFGRRYASNGEPLSTEFVINTTTHYWQSDPQVISLTTGGFVVAWEGYENTSTRDGGREGIFFRQFDEYGNPLGNEISPATYNLSTQGEPKLYAIPDGGWVIGWWSDYDPDVGIDGRNVFQRYGPAGEKIGTETEGNIIDFVLSLDGDPWPNNVVQANGQAVGGYIQSLSKIDNGYGEVMQNGPLLNPGPITGTTTQTATADGGWIVTYLEKDENADWDIQSQKINSDYSSLVLGTDENDTFVGQQYGLIARGKGGDDLILDSSVEDYLAGEAGNDEIESDGGADWILGGDGDDQITLTADSYWGSDAVAMNTTLMDLSTGAWRTAAFDVEGLGKYEKVLDGGADSDTIIMGEEGEALFLHDALSNFYPDEGLNLQTDIAGRDSTARILGIETIYAGGGDDLLDMTSFDYVSDTGLTAYGEAGNDTLWATDLNDVLYGGVGNDTLFGDAGDDILWGGEGFDRFEFSVGAGFDQIMDFNIDEDILAFYARKSRFGSEADDTDISLTNGVVSWEDVSIDLMDDTLNNLDDLNVEFTVV